MTYANAVGLVRAVIDSRGHKSAANLPMGFTEELPIVHVYQIGGVEDFLERTDRLGVDVYAGAPTAEAAQAQTALDVAEDIAAALTPGPVYTDAGTVDEAAIDQVPILRPYLDAVDVATMTILITHRPID